MCLSVIKFKARDDNIGRWHCLHSYVVDLRFLPFLLLQTMADVDGQQLSSQGSVSLSGS